MIEKGRNGREREEGEGEGENKYKRLNGVFSYMTRLTIRVFSGVVLSNLV